jgi:hypothetical protein
MIPPTPEPPGILGALVELRAPKAQFQNANVT